MLCACALSCCCCCGHWPARAAAQHARLGVPYWNADFGAPAGSAEALRAYEIGARETLSAARVHLT